MNDCPICGHRGSFRGIQSRCRFTKEVLDRFVCPSCDVVFGSMAMIRMPLDGLKREYDKLYSAYSENDTTQWEMRTFLSMKPKVGRHYLDFGCGKWSHTIGEATKVGFAVTGYDPYVGSREIGQPGTYDGIFSHNVIEHLQDPIGELLDLVLRV